MSTPIIPGAEPISITEGTRGAILLLHGYMGTVQTVRDLARAFARAGFAVEAPLLPGHGTSAEDLATTTWSDYQACVQAAYQQLAARYPRIIVAGLCIGGNLAAWLAAEYSATTVGLIDINGIYKIPHFWNANAHALDASTRPFIPWKGRGKGVENPEAEEVIGYDVSPIATLITVGAGAGEVVGRLAEIRCPVLCFTSMASHQFSPEDSTFWLKKVSGPVEHVPLPRSNHVATMDYDKDLLEARAVAFALAISEGEKVSAANC